VSKSFKPQLKTFLFNYLAALGEFLFLGGLCAIKIILLTNEPDDGSVPFYASLALASCECYS